MGCVWPGAQAKSDSPCLFVNRHAPSSQRTDLQAPFVHRAVMEPAQRDQVRELRLAAVGPMLDVMPVDVPFVAAPGENAAFVA